MSTNRRQRGTALVTSLLLLLVLTVIGITAMQVTRMEERMAGNTRDLNMAFQGAEAALRNGEDMIAAQPFAPNPAGGVCAAAPCKFWDANASDVANPESRDDAWWQGAAPTQYEASGDHSGTPTEDMPDLAHDPAFVVEYITEVPDTVSIGSGDGPPSSRFFYQVTAASPGATGNAITVLQSTYARR
ncbi:MAG TPA: PilX N-terminal domain-containing pilus assembly protein [Steroidobacteraceae bacterium]|nr:PilX N-terminal domain-containing pilus assembly protein [Steroidobacteraceae bacterium]